MDDTVAVTQNFCSRTNFPRVWLSTRKGRKKMAAKWLRKLKTSHPELAREAMQLNERDNYELYVSSKKRDLVKRKRDESTVELTTTTATAPGTQQSNNNSVNNNNKSKNFDQHQHHQHNTLHSVPQKTDRSGKVAKKSKSTNADTSVESCSAPY